MLHMPHQDQRSTVYVDIGMRLYVCFIIIILYAKSVSSVVVCTYLNLILCNKITIYYYNRRYLYYIDKSHVNIAIWAFKTLFY